MRKLFTILIYTLIVLLIGRNLTALPRFSILSNPDNYTETLKKETQTIIKDKKGNYGIYFADLKTGEGFGINEEEIFTAASVNKIPIVAVLYALENKGELDFDEQITLQKEDIQDYGTGSLRYEEPGETFSIKTLAKLALRQSDNTAAYILGNKIGTDVIQETINEWGLTQTNMEENQTSPYDMYLLFKKIYNNEITSGAKSKELLGFMTGTDIEDRLPALLPGGAKAYHKTGDGAGNLHDVGIIEYNGEVLFLSVLTADIGPDEKTAKETISNIAKNTVEFYEKRK